MPSTAQSETYAIDPVHTTVEFSVRHLMISKVRGRFTKVSGDITTDESGIPTRVEVSIDAASVDTHEEKRDGHLRSADFLDTEQHATLAFSSSDIRSDGTSFQMRGPLTIAGATHDVEFTGELSGKGNDMHGGARVGYEATATIKRSDFGLTFNMPLESGGVVIGDEVKIELNVEGIRK